MRRIMLEMSQSKLGEELGITFQQVQKYENGINRIGSSRLQQIANALQVPISFFFEGLSQAPGRSDALANVNEFLGSSTGLALVKAFQMLKNQRLRRRIVQLVEELADAGR
jgi:transcriptional regulator with XRE-family HTH domain